MKSSSRSHDQALIFGCIATSEDETIQISYNASWAPIITRSAAADAESDNGLLCGNRSMDSMQKLARFLEGF